VRTARLGSLEVSVVGLGCNNFGRALDQAGARDVVHAALEAGINVFDSSDNYGEGRSESYLAAALGEHRDRVVIATKFGMPISGIPDSGGAQPGYIRKAIERSLDQLGTDYIDLYQLHRPDPEVPIEDTLVELNALVDEGKVREIACSNLDAEQLSESAGVARTQGLRPFLANQIQYSLLHRAPESDGSVDLCEREQIALLPYYPLASGMLTGKARLGQPIEGRLQMERYQGFLTESNFEVVEGLRGFASERGISMVQVALGWLLAQPTVPFVTAGATKPDQVNANVAAADWIPSTEDLEELDRITDPRFGSEHRRQESRAPRQNRSHKRPQSAIPATLWPIASSR
jgi:aryl-alcohol dehydrogenase-like predicted oxidoreductase